MFFGEIEKSFSDTAFGLNDQVFPPEDHLFRRFGEDLFRLSAAVNVGVIEEIAPNDTGFKVGDKVLALAPGHSAMAEYYLASVDNLFKLSDDPF